MHSGTTERQPHSEKTRKRKALRPSQRRWLQQLEAYVDNHLHQSDIPVRELAGVMLVSERQLYRKLKKYTGLTPHSFVRARRLAYAKRLLDQGRHDTVAEVAERVGYQRKDYFSRLFMETYGLPPEELCDN